jgi:hypothetical protein
MATSWSLDNVYSVKPCKGGDRVPDALNGTLSVKGENKQQKTNSVALSPQANYTD